MSHSSTLKSVQLSGPPIPARGQSLEEIIRPFAATGRGIAFAGENTRVELTYACLAGQAATAAARLEHLGVGAGEYVAMTVTNDVPSVLAVLGTWIAGATVVSLPPPPRRATSWLAPRFGEVLARIGCRFLVQGDDPVSGTPSAAGLCGIPKLAMAERSEEQAAAPDAAAPQTALIQFTSGSIGSPKGVAISSQALAGHLAAIISTTQLDGEADRIVSWLPLYHDMGLIVMFLMGLAGRVDQVLAQPAGFAVRPAMWLTMLAGERATITAAPDFGYRLAAAVPYPEQLDLSRLRLSISGGERLMWQTLADFQARAEPMGLRWEALCPAYGLAEATVAVSCNPLGRGPRRGPAGHVSVGHPVPGVTVQAPAGSAPGPIELRSESLLSGYHGDGGFDQIAADEWFDTGDEGFIDDGDLYVVGRRDEVLALAGRNVFAEDIESAAHEACGRRLQACAAFRHPTADRFGLLAEVSPRLVKDTDTARALAGHIQVSVASAVGARPTPVLVVRAGTIPRTTSGKVQRARCRSLYGRGELGKRLLAELN